MLCENCKRREASVHSVTIINGVKKEHYLCAECAKGVQFSLPSLMDILSGFHIEEEEKTLEQQCSCGCSYSTFQKTGLLGCPACYRTFAQRLTPVIKRAQSGKMHHVGRIPDSIQKDVSEVLRTPESQAQIEQDEGKRLRLELHKAIEEERYERAAELRDRLRALEGESNI